MSFTVWLGQHEYFPQDLRSTMPELNKLLQEATQADVLVVESNVVPLIRPLNSVL